MSKVIGAGFDFSTSLAQYPNDNIGVIASSSVTADTFGAWVVLSADIGSEDIYLEYLSTSIERSIKSQYQIGVGAGGSEVVITDNSYETIINQETKALHPQGKVKVQAGSRLAVRVKDEDAIVRNHLIWEHYSKR